MLKYHERYPIYGFDKHKGYGTVAHDGLCLPVVRAQFTEGASDGSRPIDVSPTAWTSG